MLERFLKEKENPSFCVKGELNKANAETFCYWLRWWADRDPNQIITVFIDSPGGELYAATKMAESIQTVPNKVRTVAWGDCYSGAALLVASGNKGERYAYKHSSHFMIHKLQTGIEGSMDEITETSKVLKEISDRFLELMSKYTGRSVEQLRKDTKKDRWLMPEKAKEFGLIDVIVDPPRK